MDLATMIREVTTIAQLSELAERFPLGEAEKELVFQRRVEIMTRLLEWSLENETFGLEGTISDSWTPEQRATFIEDWMDDEPFVQEGRGRERDQSEMIGDDEGPGTSQDEVRGSFLTIKQVKQVRVRKFAIIGMDYEVQFKNTYANRDLFEYHNLLHDIFQSLLQNITNGISANDQVRFVLRSPQLEYPISLPFMPRERLTSERVLAEVERVVQSNHEIRLNDSVSVNIVHVEMPRGGTGKRRRQVNLDKYLTNKRSIVRIQNSNDICLARAFVVAIAKIENDEHYNKIRDPRYSVQERLA